MLIMITTQRMLQIHFYFEVCCMHLLNIGIVFVISQISNRFFQAIPTEEVKQHLFKILVDTLLETKDIVIGNAVKSSLLKVSGFRIERLGRKRMLQFFAEIEHCQNGSKFSMQVCFCVLNILGFFSLGLPLILSKSCRTFGFCWWCL